MAIHFHEEDLPSANLFAADAAIAVDTEAMGLVPGRDRLCLVQLSDGSGDEHLVRFAPDALPEPKARPFSCAAGLELRRSCLRAGDECTLEPPPGYWAWGGHKGSGLGIVVQLLGALAGGPAIPGELAGFGMVIIAISPDLLTNADHFAREVSAYAESIRGARPIEGGPPVRMPFDRSRAERSRQLAENSVDVADAVYSRLVEIAG